MPNRPSIFDNHIHLRADFRGVEAAREFERAGGTAFLLTHMPYDDLPIRRPSDYSQAYERTLAMAQAVRRSSSIEVFVALGPYPVDLVHLAKEMPLDRALDILKDGVDQAAQCVSDGRAVALGEVGRPHFPVPPDVWAASNEVLAYAMASARRLGCAIVIHSEDPTPQTFAEFAGIAAKSGLPTDRVVKHHSTPLTASEHTHGIVPSILAKEDLLVEALRGQPRFLLETDYIDDPRRPGAVLGPATVPRKTRAWRAKGLVSEETCRLIHEELPEKTYGIELHT